MFTSFLFYIFSFTFIIGDSILNTENVTDSDSILIQNSFVTCYINHFVIHLYYFPYGYKTIKYSDIRSCELLRNDDLNLFQTKCWGMALSPVWWHADLRREWREYLIILDANQWPKIGLTMDDHDTIKVYKLIKQKMGLTLLDEELDMDCEK